MSGSGASLGFLVELPRAAGCCVVSSAWGSACWSQAGFPGLCGPRVLSAHAGWGWHSLNRTSGHGASRSVCELPCGRTSRCVSALPDPTRVRSVLAFPLSGIRKGRWWVSQRSMVSHRDFCFGREAFRGRVLPPLRGFRASSQSRSGDRPCPGGRVPSSWGAPSCPRRATWALCARGSGRGGPLLCSQEDPSFPCS